MRTNNQECHNQIPVWQEVLQALLWFIPVKKLKWPVLKTACTLGAMFPVLFTALVDANLRCEESPNYCRSKPKESKMNDFHRFAMLSSLLMNLLTDRKPMRSETMKWHEIRNFCVASYALCGQCERCLVKLMCWLMYSRRHTSLT